MKNILHFLFICFLSISLFSCNKDDDSIDYDWKYDNEVAFLKKSEDPAFKKVFIPQGPGFVYYKEIEENTTTNIDTAKYTSVVRIYYKGRLINGNVFDDSTINPFTFKIDGSTFYINGETNTGTSVISGWKVALQNMKEGDHWEVWIPYTLGYGSSDRGSIPAYSTLVFEMKMDKIVQLYPLPKEDS